MRVGVVAMSTLLYTILGLTVGSSLHCAMRKEISPCTCRRQDASNTVIVSCERMSSFGQVVDALQHKFPPTDPMFLHITHSKLDDLPLRSFHDLNITIVNLKLNHDNLSDLPESAFSGLTHTVYFSLADNAIPAIPRHILAKMPYVKTIDIGRGRIQSLTATNFKSTPYLQHLVLAGNRISILEERCFPNNLKRLHIGRNMITTLNGTLRDMPELEWLFINSNRLTNLEGQLPQNGDKMILIHASNNFLEKLPQDLKNLPKIESLFFQQNLITSLDGAVSKSRKLQRLMLTLNRIRMLSEDEFLETESLHDLQLGHNQITSLNNSLLPLRSLQCINMTHNLLTEFSLQEIRGLTWLRIVDLSHNMISKLGGRMENLVEWESQLTELRLDHNQLRSLDGSLNGLHDLLRLNLSHNRLTSIAPDDLIGLDNLRMLDISHNQLTTLEETSKTFLPTLEELFASHNLITMLERDFHGLPVLCWADLSHNQIRYLGRELVTKSRCIVHRIPGKLKIYLEDNPILCDDELPEIMSVMEVNDAKIQEPYECTAPPKPYVVTEERAPLLETSPAYQSNSDVLAASVPASAPASLPMSVPVSIPASVPVSGIASVGASAAASAPSMTGSFASAPIGTGSYASAPSASGSYGSAPSASGSYVSGSFASGSYASGSSGSGSYASVPSASGTFASASAPSDAGAATSTATGGVPSLAMVQSQQHFGISDNQIRSSGVHEVREVRVLPLQPVASIAEGASPLQVDST